MPHPVRLSVLVFVVLLWLVPSQPAASQTGSADALARLVDQFHDAGLFTGSALLAENGAVLYAGGVGLADAAWEIPNTASTRFRIGSLTKQFTATLVMQLVEQDVLRLDAPITRYLPDYPAGPGDRVTLHHLLGHTSGIPSYTDLATFETEVRRASLSPDELVATFSGLDLDFEPGTSTAYSNSNYVVLAVVLERVTGEAYSDLLRERLFEPLGLRETAYDDGRTVLSHLAEGYGRLGGTLERTDPADPSWAFGAGGIVSTVGDLHRWTEALYRGDPFQHPETAVRMRTPGDTPVAYGLMVYDQPVGALSVPTIVHGGYIYGFASVLAYMPDEGRTLVLLDNTGGDVTPALIGLTAQLYGQPVQTPRPSIADEVARVLARDGAVAAAAHYRALRQTEPEAYAFGESQLNGLGYAYLGRGDTEAAVQVFALNAEAYPESANTHDSLGEAYLAAGATDEAIASYQRALALDPRSASALAALRELGQDVASAPDPPSVVVPESVLDQHVGAYELQPGFVLTISREGDGLTAQVPGQAALAMQARSETEFSVPDLGAKITFTRAADGSTSSLRLDQNGGSLNATRVD